MLLTIALAIATSVLLVHPAHAQDFETFSDWSSRHTTDAFTDESKWMAITPTAKALESNQLQPFVIYTASKLTMLIVQTTDISLIGAENPFMKFRIDGGEIFERITFHSSGTIFVVDSDIEPIVSAMLLGEQLAIRVTSAKETWTHKFSLLGFTEASKEVRHASGGIISKEGSH